jgi:hypothetical protein
MLEGLKLFYLTTDSDTHLSSYQQCLIIMICNPPMQSCFFSECKDYPGSSKVTVILENIFEENNHYLQRVVNNNRSTLETIIKSSEDFLDTLTDKLSALLRYSFMASQHVNFPMN